MSTTTLGLYVLFGVLWLPLYLILIGWFTDAPNDVRTAAIGLGYFVAIATAIIGSTVVLALFLGLFTPV
ncbi:putative membrane protein [Halalkaliarchaeum sp. AArc-CO]|uniref:hypothetical protein n=1 Tax=unclassified Halalkaliarchaeum TaxID=2678344 RepID=UPI00217CC581|nr:MULTISPECIES: hypothetical protein [unclassified Halalkaliarchaeum]MDR5672531.1 hypothetical protein [Halalkaliarchaeum sp. AArc-GB]UWG50519.1 putative membrane protein [Halalkaliarchaeum sp. AArc-CO]